MGQLNIKDEVLIGKLRRIAERRSTSVTDALRQLVAAAEAQEAERVAQRLADIREITRGSAKLFPPDWDGDHSYLYDENGLPK